jgi:hypothetical protein
MKASEITVGSILRDEPGSIVFTHVGHDKRVPVEVIGKRPGRGRVFTLRRVDTGRILEVPRSIRQLHASQRGHWTGLDESRANESAATARDIRVLRSPRRELCGECVTQLPLDHHDHGDTCPNCGRWFAARGVVVDTFGRHLSERVLLPEARELAEGLRRRLVGVIEVQS